MIVVCNGKPPTSIASFGAFFLGPYPQEKCGEKPLLKYGLARYRSYDENSKLMHVGLEIRSNRSLSLKLNITKS